MLVVEEMPENVFLVLFHHHVLPSDEGREESEMLGGHVSSCTDGLLEERRYLVIYGVCVDHPFDGYWVVLEDCHQTFLYKGLVDFVGVLNKELDPS
jgi:hypothetical protein